MKVTDKELYPDAQSLLDKIDFVVKETDIVLDIGCGIVPMNYFRPKLHIMAEPWDEYSNILQHRHANDKSILIVKLGALETLAAFHDNSIDSIFLLDVIEHLEKDVGFKVISEIERVARLQAVIFTPLGFMPQHMEAGEPDAWGLLGGEMQEHKSGWLPEDFSPGWKFYVCETYHNKNFKGEQLEKPYGAFFAIRNFEQKQSAPPKNISDIRRPLPSEIALQKLQISMNEIMERNQSLEAEKISLEAEKISLEAEKISLAESLQMEISRLSSQNAKNLSELQAIKESRLYKALSILRHPFSTKR